MPLHTCMHSPHMHLQDQWPHQDAGMPESLSILIQLRNTRRFDVFEGSETKELTLHPGDMLLFNRNVWHRGCANRHDSVCIFLYVDTCELKSTAKEVADLQQGFHAMLSLKDYLASQGSREPYVFNFCEPKSLYEVPHYLNNSFRDVASTKNTKGTQ